MVDQAISHMTKSYAPGIHKEPKLIYENGGCEKIKMPRNTRKLLPLNKRYDAFCKEAEELLEQAGLNDPNQPPKIFGKALFNLFAQLVAMHFPDDKKIYGVGPRGLIQNMDSSFDKDNRQIGATRSLVFLIRSIIKNRPPLDIKKSTTKEKQPNESLVGCPFFEENRNYKEIQHFVFVLMPFKEKWSDRIWNDHLRNYLSTTPSGKRLVVRRADEMFGQGVMEDIFEGICTAGLIVAECTGRNPNVLYELGMAHSFGKRSILLS